MKNLEEQLNAQQEVVKKTNQEMQAQRDQMEKNNNEMIKQVRGLQEKLNQENAVSSSKLKEYEEKINGLQTRLDQAAEEKVESQVEIETLSEKYQSTVKKLSELEKQVDEYSRLNASLQNDKENLTTSQTNFLEAQLETQQAILDSKHAEYELRVSKVKENGFSKWHELETQYIDMVRRTKAEHETAKQYFQNDKKASDIRQQILRTE